MKYKIKIKPGFVLTGIAMMLFSLHGFSQDCKGHFEVDAGPGIDVCGGIQGSSVQLHGSIGGDASVATWRGGKGKFVPDRNTVNAEYYPAPEETGLGVVLILVANNPKFNCPPARSEIKIIVNSQPKANAGGNKTACSGASVQLDGKVTGKAKRVTWSTTGSGTFDDAHKPDAIYTPSKSDGEKGGCSLKFLAEAYGVCLPDSDAMSLSVMKGPEFETASESNTTGTQEVKLSLTAKEGAGAINWSSAGTGTFKDAASANTVYTPSADDVTKGTIKLEVSVASVNNSCTAKKQVVLNIGKNKM